MSTLYEIKKQVAAYLGKSLTDLTVNGQDLCLAAFNQVRKMAELEHDFEFNRRLVTVTVNGITGGSLENAVDGILPVEVKTVIDVGLVSGAGNLVPARWTTVAENFESQRQSNRRASPMWLTDAEAEYGTLGVSGFTFSGSSIYRWPRTSETDATNYSLNLEVYAFSSDWTATDLGEGDLVVTGTMSPDVTGVYFLVGTDSNSNYVYASTTATISKISTNWWIITFAGNKGWSHASTLAGAYTAAQVNGQTISTGAPTVTATTATSDIWTTHGSQFLLWQTIVHLNKLFRVFVPRQEGNLPPPTDLADAGLQTLVDWDANKFEQFRRHNR